MAGSLHTSVWVACEQAHLFRWGVATKSWREERGEKKCIFPRLILRPNFTGSQYPKKRACTQVSVWRVSGHVTPVFALSSAIPWHAPPTHPWSIFRMYYVEVYLFSSHFFCVIVRQLCCYVNKGLAVWFSLALLTAVCEKLISAICISLFFF